MAAGERTLPSVGAILAASLAAHDIDRVFCVPGESYLGLLDGLYEQAGIDVVTCRHEGSAGFMAIADARLSGRPGVLCVSRGPGAANAAIAVHTAEQDAVPLILIVGQVPRADLRRGSFQEIDYHHMYGRIAKWTCELVDPDDMEEAFRRAWQAAMTGTPGPVVLAVPEDVLTAPTSADMARPQASPECGVPSQAMDRLAGWIDEARRPLLIAGGGIDVPGGREALLRFSEQMGVPVAVSFRRHDLFPNDHPYYVGDLGLSNPAGQIALFGQADLVLALGTRLGDITTQNYRFPGRVNPSSRLVHVHADPSVLGRHFRTDLALACPPIQVLDGLNGRGSRASDPIWLADLQGVRDRGNEIEPMDAPDGIPFEHVVARVGRGLPADAIVTVDAGTFGAPVYRDVAFRPPQRLLAPISGAMGFGIPAAVASALRHPDRPILCFVGDGGFLMTCAELAVAAERKLDIKLVVSENGSYGSIRIHQERDYPGRVVGTTLFNPALDEIGRAFGFRVTRIRTVAEFDLLEEALAAPGPQFILVRSSLLAAFPWDGAGQRQ